MNLTQVDFKQLQEKESRTFIAVKFQQSRAENFRFVLSCLRNAELYQNGKIYLAGFQQTKPDLAALAWFLNEIREWKNVNVLADGRPIKSRTSLLNMLHCYLIAAELPEPKDHCHEVVKDPFIVEPDHRESLTIDFASNEFWALEGNPDKWLLPCKYLKGFLRTHKSDKPRAIEKLKALAAEKNCNLCPYFRAQDFRAI